MKSTELKSSQIKNIVIKSIGMNVYESKMFFFLTKQNKKYI